MTSMRNINLIQARKYLIGVVLIALLIWADGINSQDMTISTGKTTTVTINNTTKTLYAYIDNASSSNFWMDLKMNLSFDKDGTFSVTVSHTDGKVPANSFKKTFQLSKSSTSNRILQQITPGSTSRYIQIDIVPPVGLLTAQMDVYVKFGDFPLSDGDIIGIVIGCIAAGLLLSLFGSFYFHKLKSKRQRLTMNLMIDTFFETIRELGYLTIRFIMNIKDAISKLDCAKPASDSETPQHHHYNPNQQPVQNYDYNTYNTTNTTQMAITTASTNANQESKSEDTAVQYGNNDYDDIEQVDPIQVHIDTTNLKQDIPKQQEINVYEKQSEPLAPAYEEPSIVYEPPKVDPVDYAQIVLPQPTPIDDNVPRLPRVFVPQAVTPSPILQNQVYPNQAQQDDNIVIPNIPLPANLV